jgi:hypothetical protein
MRYDQTASCGMALAPTLGVATMGDYAHVADFEWKMQSR